MVLTLGIYEKHPSTSPVATSGPPLSLRWRVRDSGGFRRATVTKECPSAICVTMQATHLASTPGFREGFRARGIQRARLGAGSVRLSSRGLSQLGACKPVPNPSGHQGSAAPPLPPPGGRGHQLRVLLLLLGARGARRGQSQRDTRRAGGGARARGGATEARAARVWGARGS